MDGRRICSRPLVLIFHYRHHLTLADEIQRRYFEWLDQPVQRVTGAEASPSISRVLERAAIAQSDEVRAALVKMTQ